MLPVVVRVNERGITAVMTTVPAENGELYAVHVGEGDIFDGSIDYPLLAYHTRCPTADEVIFIHGVLRQLGWDTDTFVYCRDIAEWMVRRAQDVRTTVN